ncbi:MAG: YqhV family protein [Bacillota bacterium]|nr:YqhV family protein [Bacillota bacterium]NLJ03950.1 YqhV family protein [Bacillota bacterium]
MTTELRAVLTMALLRLIAGTIEISAGLLMLKFGRVQTALKINSVLGLIGPIILTLVGTVGLIGLSSQLSWSRLTLTALGVLLIFLGTR